MKNFYSELEAHAKKNNSIVCVGIDPVIESIPVQSGSKEQRILKFYKEIVNAFISEDELPAGFKLNYAFFAQYGFEGLNAMKKLIEFLHSKKFYVVFDGKRNDIGHTAEAYAKECFDFWDADAITVTPFLGSDGIIPFLKKAGEKGKGVYILNKTSNPSSKELQDLKLKNNSYLYITISRNLIKSSLQTPNAIGAVVGATHPAELNEISKILSKKNIPILLPGIGAQGGDLKKAMDVLNKNYDSVLTHRINSSRGISFAFKESNSRDYAGSAVKALKRLNDETNKFI